MDGSRPVQYWQIWTARLAFVLIFEVLLNHLLHWEVRVFKRVDNYKDGWNVRM